MRQLRALFFTLACVVGAVLGTASVTHSDSMSGSRLADCSARPSCTGQPSDLEALGHPVPGEVPDDIPGEAPPPSPAAVSPVAASPRSSPATMHEALMEATAVRHVPTAAQPASDDLMDPMIDKAMILLIGWGMLMLLGGGIIAGNRQLSARHALRR